METLKQVLALVWKSKVLTFTCISFLVTGIVVGVLYFPQEWPVWGRLGAGFAAALIAVLYAVGNHVLMEMDDSVSQADKERAEEEARKSLEEKKI